MKERERMLRRLGILEAVLVHYDVSHAEVRSRTALQRFLFGRHVELRMDGRMKTYHYPGLIDEGAEWVGQSVFLLPPDLSTRLLAKLRDLRIEHRTRTVFVSA